MQGGSENGNALALAVGKNDSLVSTANNFESQHLIQYPQRGYLFKAMADKRGRGEIVVSQGFIYHMGNLTTVTVVSL